MASGNFFKNYFYGRSDQRDFTEADLPQNRLQLFRDVLSVRRGSMAGVNLFYLLFWIPAIFWSFMNLVQLYQLSPADPAAFASQLGQLAFSYLLILFPLIALTGPFNMGVSFIFRNWARDEHSFIFADFKAALKENWKQGLLYGAVSGAVPLVSYICVRFYLGMAKSTPFAYLPLMITVFAALAWFLCAPILPTMIVTYRQGFFAMVRNALLMCLAVLPRTVALRLASLVVPLVLAILLMLFPSALGWATAAAVTLYAVFLLSFNKLMWASFANALCETYLNPKIEGARTGIGLRPTQNAEEKK